MIELIWQACLTYDIESHRVRRLAEEELRPALPADRDRLLALRFGSHRGARRGAVRDGPRAAAGPSVREAMNTIAYCQPFVPPEWIAAHGLRPQWLRPQTAASSGCGGQPRRVPGGRGLGRCRPAGRWSTCRGPGADHHLRPDALRRRRSGSHGKDPHLPHARAEDLADRRPPASSMAKSCAGWAAFSSAVAESRPRPRRFAR